MVRVGCPFSRFHLFTFTQAPAAILAGHVLYMLLNSLLFANTTWLIPLLVRLRFGSSDPYWRDWQTTLITAAVPIFMMLSIFWNESAPPPVSGEVPAGLLARRCRSAGLHRAVHNYWQLLACHVIATRGHRRTKPVNGKLLNHFYSRRGPRPGLCPAQRGHVGRRHGRACMSSGPGWSGTRTRFAFTFRRWRCCNCWGLSSCWAGPTDADGARGGRHDPAVVGRAVRPVLHMGATLRADRTFLRYERAFMTYGAAFMLCDARCPCSPRPSSACTTEITPTPRKSS